MFGQGGFSINKLLNRISDKGQLSPTRTATSPPGSEDHLGSDEDAAAEGFLCPTCMLAFPNPDTLQNHYESNHSEESHEQRGQFICPACKMRLGSDIELQAHYKRHHTENKVRNGDLSSLKQELSELHTSLKEEKWYSDELKKEVLRLQTEIVSRSDSGDAPQVENEMLRSQNRVLEEAKNLAVSELLLVRQQLEENKERYRTVLKEKDVVEQKAALLAGELADVKAKCDEMASEEVALEYRISVQEEELGRLNSEIQQGSGVEDVQVLKEELASIQKIMDEMSLSKQLETEHLDEQLSLLQKKFDDLVLVNKELEANLQSAPTKEELDRLREAQNVSAEGKEENLELKNTLNYLEAELQSSKHQLVEKETEILRLNAAAKEAADQRILISEKLAECVRNMENYASKKKKRDEVANNERMEMQKEKALLKAEMDQLSHVGKVRQSEIDEFKQELLLLQSRYQEECAIASELKVQILEECAVASELKVQILEKTHKTKQAEEQMQRRLQELQADLQKSKENIERLESERSKLYEQIEQGEGVNTAIQQLREENLGLQEQLDKQVSVLTSHKEDFELQLENFNSQINELKVELQNSRDKFERLEEESKDLRSKVNAGKEKNRELETKLRLKSDEMALIEVSSNALSSEMEQRLRIAQARMDEKEKIITAQEEKMNQLTAINGRQGEECVRLGTLLKKETEKGSKLEASLADVTSQLTDKKEQILGLMKDKENLNQTVNHLKTIEAKFLKKEEEFLEKNNAWNEVRARLEIQLEQRSKEAEKLLENQEKSKSSLEEKLSEVISLQNQKQQLEYKLEDVSCQLRDQKMSHENAEAKLAEMQVQLTNEQSARAQMQQKANLLKERLVESQTEQQQLTSALENLQEVKQELSQKILHLDGHVRDVEKSKAELEESKKFLENEVDDCQKSLQQFEGKLQAQRKECQQSKQELHDTRELLIAQKTELSKQLETVMTEKDLSLRDHLAKEEEFHRHEEQLEESIQELQVEMEKLKDFLRESERQHEESDSRYQAQLNILNQNLTTLQDDLRGEQLLRETLQGKYEQCSGDKLELEAKLENALDERRGLLDRCLRSEDECEKLRNTTMELRRKLDDSLAALHELGRENQTLQIENTKLVNRKWADDSDVTTCMACRKGFTVTVRKHHCRNCGGIYCNECSAKTATIAAFKKPVRVCENCYSEVTK